MYKRQTPNLVGLLVGLAYVAAVIVVSRLNSDRRLARATLLLAAGYAHTPLVLSQPCVLLWVGAPLTLFLATLRPRADGFLYVALSFVFWVALSPPFIAFAAAGSWDAAVSLLSRDSVALGLPDRKLLYAGVAYVPVHAGALAYLLFAPRRPAPLDLDVELARKER